jgi:hypothetical protein
MKPNKAAWASALLAILCAMPATAGVIYRWQDITPNPHTGAFEGLIEFSYDVWSPTGHLVTSGAGFRGFSSLEGIQGIERFVWSNPSGVGLELQIELATRSCANFELPDACNSPGGEPLLIPISGAGFYTAEFDVTLGAILQGFLDVNDSTTNLLMGGGSLWTIHDTGSDGPGICFFNDGRCSGSTGLWVLDLSTLPPAGVPEPSTLALAAVAVAVLLVNLRRRRTNV